MKNLAFKINFIIVIVIISCVITINAGCQKDNHVEELYPFKLRYEVKSKQGQKVTKIKEGENFYIHFSIKNTSGKDVLISNHTHFANNELFNVYRLDNQENLSTVGNQAKQGICLDVGGCFREADILVPWTNENDTAIGLMCCNYELMENSHLPIGKYMIKYTGNIEYVFIHESYNGEYPNTGNYNIKYEFEIIK